MHPIKNKACIQKLRNGDRSTFEDVFIKFHKPLFGLAFKYLRNKDLAEDALQIVFIKLWKVRNTLDLEVSIDRFLFRALKNHIVDQILNNTSSIIKNYDYHQGSPSEGREPEFRKERLLEKVTKRLPDARVR